MLKLLCWKQTSTGLSNSVTEGPYFQSLSTLKMAFGEYDKLDSNGSMLLDRSGEEKWFTWKNSTHTHNIKCTCDMTPAVPFDMKQTSSQQRAGDAGKRGWKGVKRSHLTGVPGEAGY